MKVVKVKKRKLDNAKLVVKIDLENELLEGVWIEHRCLDCGGYGCHNRTCKDEIRDLSAVRDTLGEAGVEIVDRILKSVKTTL